MPTLNTAQNAALSFYMVSYYLDAVMFGMDEFFTKDADDKKLTYQSKPNKGHKEQVKAFGDELARAVAASTAVGMPLLPETFMQLVNKHFGIIENKLLLPEPLKFGGVNYGPNRYTRVYSSQYAGRLYRFLYPDCDEAVLNGSSYHIQEDKQRVGYRHPPIKMGFFDDNKHHMEGNKQVSLFIWRQQNRLQHRDAPRPHANPSDLLDTNWHYLVARIAYIFISYRTGGVFGLGRERTKANEIKGPFAKLTYLADQTHPTYEKDLQARFEKAYEIIENETWHEGPNANDSEDSDKRNETVRLKQQAKFCAAREEALTLLADTDPKLIRSAKILELILEMLCSVASTHKLDHDQTVTAVIANFEKYISNKSKLRDELKSADMSTLITDILKPLFATSFQAQPSDDHVVNIADNDGGAARATARTIANSAVARVKRRDDDDDDDGKSRDNDVAAASSSGAGANHPFTPVREFAAKLMALTPDNLLMLLNKLATLDAVKAKIGDKALAVALRDAITKAKIDTKTVISDLIAAFAKAKNDIAAAAAAGAGDDSDNDDVAAGAGDESDNDDVAAGDAAGSADVAISDLVRRFNDFCDGAINALASVLNHSKSDEVAFMQKVESTFTRINHEMSLLPQPEDGASDQEGQVSIKRQELLSQISLAQTLTRKASVGAAAAPAAREADILVYKRVCDEALAALQTFIDDQSQGDDDNRALRQALTGLAASFRPIAAARPANASDALKKAKTAAEELQKMIGLALKLSGNKPVDAIVTEMRQRIITTVGKNVTFRPLLAVDSEIKQTVSSLSSGDDASIWEKSLVLYFKQLDDALGCIISAVVIAKDSNGSAASAAVAPADDNADSDVHSGWRVGFDLGRR